MPYDPDILAVDLAILEARATAFLTHAVLLPTETRFGCQHPIHGTHGYFAGCADGGEGNKALLHSHIATTEKNGEKKGIGGMHHEVALHEHMQGRAEFIKANGRAAYDAKLSDLTKKATDGAKGLSKADVKTLQTHQKALIKEAAALEKAGRSAGKQRAEATMIQRQLKRSVTGTKTAAKAKSTETEKPLVPRITGKALNIGRDEKPNPYTIHEMFGTRQLKQALRGYTVATLKDMVGQVQAKHPGTKPTSMANRDALVEYLYEHVSKDDGHIE